MAYEKQTWVDGVTPLDAEHLNHMEQGISQFSAGEPGGWYTPEIKQPINGTMVVNFTPSKEGMPDVPGKSIILPQGDTGEAGGYYAPSVDNEGNLTWTASKESMPAVDGANIKGSQGKSAYQYAVEGGYTGTEAEFAAKLAAEKLANPYALTFTGAVTGSYDGSAPLSVEIPSGGSGGSSGGVEVLVDFTTEEAVTEFTIPKTVIGPLASKIKEASIILIQLIIPRDTTDTSITTTGTVDIKAYVGWLTGIIGGTFNAIIAPSETYNNTWAINLIITKVPYSAGSEPRSCLIQIFGRRNNANPDTAIQRNVGDYFVNFYEGSYITVVGSQTMAAGTRFIMGVIA